MNKKIIVIGDTAAPYHPLDNVFAMEDLLCDYCLTFTDDHDYFLELREFCVCVCYIDSWKRPLSDSQAAALKEYLFNGGKLINMHNGMSLQDTPGFADVLGAKFTHHPPYGRLLIKTAAGHPATEGVQDFYIYDEPYHFEIYGELNIFASYDFNGAILPAAWESLYGKGTLIYLMPGHDKSAFQCESYRRLIKNSVSYLYAK